jgi:oxygen-independent coproporphyrinogen-3 oxidase
VSAYALTIEPATALGRQVAAGAPAPDDDLQADAYALADDTFAAAGMQWYEVSNWARPGEECRHNELYWTGGDYLAVGCAAHGHTAPRRWWNVRTPERYIAAIEGGTSAVAGDEVLDPKTRAEEAFALALRTRAGARFDPRARTVVADLAEQHVLDAYPDDSSGDRIVLTRRGRLLASDLTARLLLAGAAPDLDRVPDPDPDPGAGPAPSSPLLSGTRYH